MAKTDINIPKDTPEVPKSQAVTTEDIKVIPNPNDEFPINVDVYCRIKRVNILLAKVFVKAMNVESRNRRHFIADWDMKYNEFFNRKV